MNLLLDAPPQSVCIDGKSYPLDTRWRTALRVMAAFEDEGLAVAEKQAVMLALLYKEGAPPDTARAAAAAVRFLNGGRQPGGEGDAAPGGGRCFSWQKDGALIFSAIQATHGIDLAKQEDMHWWAFVALFMDLKEDCLFCRLADLRRRRKAGKLTREEKAWCAANRQLVELPNARTAAENAAVAEFVGLMGE